MRRTNATCLAAVLSLAMLAPLTTTRAQSPAPITPPAATTTIALDEVLASLERHPQLVAAAVRVDGAEGAVLTAQGAFDLSLNASASAVPGGYYNYGQADTSLTQATPWWGTSFFAGWRIGRGWDNGFPDYYGQRETLNAGELRAGATLPLWQNGAIDGRRAGIRRAEAGREVTQQDARARRLRLALAATEAYVRWITAAKKFAIANDLLRIAVERDTQIQQRVAAGAIAAIESLENERVILERRSTAVSAQRQTERGAIALSLFLRDASGRPKVPSFEQAPAEFDFGPWPEVDTDASAATERAWSLRPEIQRLSPLAESARVARDLADNQVSPRVDLTVQGSVDLGSGAPDAAYQDRLARPVFETSLQVAIPLQLREARGRRQTASAELRQVETEIEFARNTVEAEVRDALSAYRNAVAAVELAEHSLTVARQVRDAERSRFDNGLSTLLMVNLREASAAQAQAVLVDARADLALSHAQFGAAVGTLQ